MASAGSGSLHPRLNSAGGLSFREVGDWFKNLGDDIGSMMGLPRARSTRRPTPSGPSGLGARAMSDLGGVQPRLPSTSILAKQQQVGARFQRPAGAPAGRQRRSAACPRAMRGVPAACRRRGRRAVRRERWCGSWVAQPRPARLLATARSWWACCSSTSTSAAAGGTASLCCATACCATTRWPGVGLGGLGSVGSKSVGWRRAGGLAQGWVVACWLWLEAQVCRGCGAGSMLCAIHLLRPDQAPAHAPIPIAARAAAAAARRCTAPPPSTCTSCWRRCASRASCT